MILVETAPSKSAKSSRLAGRRAIAKGISMHERLRSKLRVNSNLVGFLTCVVLAVSHYGQRLDAGEKTLLSNQGLVVPAEMLNFGDHWPGVIKHALRLQNTTSREIEVVGYCQSCGCTAITPPAFTVAPHGTIDVEVTITLPPLLAGKWQALEPLSLVLAPRVKGSIACERGWTLKGRIRRPYQADRQSLSFVEEQGVTRGQESKAQAIAIEPLVSLSKLEARSDDASVSASVHKEPSGAYQVIVRPSPDAPAGVRNTAIQLVGATIDGSSIPPISIPILLQVREPVRLLPDRIALGIVPLQSVQEKSVTLHCVNGNAFVVERIESPPSTKVTEQPPSSKGTERTFKVDQRIEQAGSHLEVIRFTVRDDKSRQFTVELPVSFFAL